MKNPHKLRLILWPDCNRNCPGCCNNDHDLDSIETVKSFKGYKEILVTGGEPLLYPGELHRRLWTIRTEADRGTKIFLYTADYSIKKHARVIDIVSGLTITIHEQSDVESMIKLFDWLKNRKRDSLGTKQLRLNIFEGISYPKKFGELFKIKDDIQWLKNCPLPEGEVLMRCA